jgi:hypothetical protein
MNRKIKLYYKVWTNIHSTEFNSRLQFLARIIQIFPKLYTGRQKRKLRAGNLQNVLRTINLRHHHHVDKQWYKCCRGEGELPGCSHSLNGRPSDAWNIIIVSRQRAQGRCFLDLRHFEAFEFFADRARYEKRSSTAKGLLLGAFFSAEGPLSKKHLRQDDMQVGT